MTLLVATSFYMFTFFVIITKYYFIETLCYGRLHTYLCNINTTYVNFDRGPIFSPHRWGALVSEEGHCELESWRLRFFLRQKQTFCVLWSTKFVRIFCKKDKQKSCTTLLTNRLLTIQHGNLSNAFSKVKKWNL